LVSGHVNRFQQVFMNLFLNACKAMPDGGALKVTAKRSAEDCVVVEVEDTGCGIPDEDKDQIFNAFFYD
jgi:signal transduction histidine kinase